MKAEGNGMDLGQSYDSWFTVYPSTHEKAGQSVNVVTCEWVRKRNARLVEALERIMHGAT